MKDWQKRVVEERNQLQEKILKLNDFIKGPKFKSLPLSDREMIVFQKQVMLTYFRILELRIDSFNRV